MVSSSVGVALFHDLHARSRVGPSVGASWGASSLASLPASEGGGGASDPPGASRRALPSVPPSFATGPPWLKSPRSEEHPEKRTTASAAAKVEPRMVRNRMSEAPHGAGRAEPHERRHVQARRPRRRRAV